MRRASTTSASPGASLGYHVSDAGSGCDVLPPAAFAFSVAKLTLADCRF